MSTRPDLHIREVDRNNWDDFVSLFEGPGGPKYCWCMAWRAKGAEAKEMTAADRRSALERRVREGTPIGLLGYVEQQPVAWCSIAPRSTYRPLGGLVEEGEQDGSVWSLVCFYIKRPLRGRGLASALIEQAVAYARRNGGKVVEAYPVLPDSPSYRFMGFVSLFEAAGFQHVGRAGTRRHVMRRHL
jgi:GNAT superfamily N-acetyltransferase